MVYSNKVCYGPMNTIKWLEIGRRKKAFSMLYVCPTTIIIVESFSSLSGMVCLGCVVRSV